MPTMLAAKALQACGVFGVWTACWTWLFPTMLGAGVSCGVVSALRTEDTAASTIDSQMQSKQISVASHQCECTPGPRSSTWVPAARQLRHHGFRPRGLCLARCVAFAANSSWCLVVRRFGATASARAGISPCSVRCASTLAVHVLLRQGSETWLTVGSTMLD